MKVLVLSDAIPEWVESLQDVFGALNVEVKSPAGAKGLAKDYDYVIVFSPKRVQELFDSKERAQIIAVTNERQAAIALGANAVFGLDGAGTEIERFIVDREASLARFKDNKSKKYILIAGR